MSHALALKYHRSSFQLLVVPYVHGRLVFAETVARTLQKNSFDTVLLDLPSFMNHGSWLDAPLASFPLVSSLLIKGDKDTCSLFPLVPTDAACAAAWLARKNSMDFECVDTMILPSSSRNDIPAFPSLGDERLISSIGLESHFEAAWRQLDALWENNSDSNTKNLILRGKAVVNRIRDRIASGRKVLFVCEYRLWWAVSRALEMEACGRRKDRKNTARCPARSCALLLEDPYVMWAAGLFDDYLTVNKRFQESLQSESVVSFAKHRVLAELIDNVFNTNEPMNMRAGTQETLSSFVQDLREKIKSDGSRLAPAMFFEIIRSRLGPQAEDSLARILLDYPVPSASDAATNPPQYFEISEDRIFPGGERFDLPDVFHANPYGECRVSESETNGNSSQEVHLGLVSRLYGIHPVITRQEAKAVGIKTTGARWAVKRDYELHGYAGSIVRQAVLRAENLGPREEELGVFTPIAFIFCKDPPKPVKYTVISDNNLARRQIDMGGTKRKHQDKMPPPDSVYSLFATVQALDSLFEEHIEKELITSLTLLFSGSEMGLERYAALNERPPQYQCRTRPQDDKELSAFAHSNLGLAWAIKYAERNTIAVAYQGWEPSPDIRQFAWQRQKRILTLTLDILPQDLTDRLQQLHFISNAIKLHAECDGIVSRFVR